MDLSILIPARNEEWLARTIEDIIEHKEGKTEVIAVLDGYWPDPPVKDHPDVTLIYFPESVGQRAGMNQACRLSKAKYVMKVDAHCTFDQGFDVKMMEEMKDHYTMVPVMRNLHAFDWVCKKCGNRWYQGPTPTHCFADYKAKKRNKECDSTEFERDIKWRAKPSPNSTAFRFDRTLHFQYWGKYKKKQKGDIVDTMSIQGSCFMMTREKYWELEIADEGHGSWGQQGVEVACKTWLSGGEVKCNKKTWYAHLFRTQGGDFGFPYPNPGISKARQYSRDLWFNNKWPKAKHDLQWLIDKFAPVPDWDFKKGVVYYTDSELREEVAKPCREQLQRAFPGERDDIITVSLKPLDFGKNIVMDGYERGALTLFKQILAGLEASDADIVFFAEHDVLYHPSHFDFVPPKSDRFYYNVNVWKVRTSDGHSLKVDKCRMTSGLCAYRDVLLEHYKKRVKLVEKNGFSRKMGFEPGTHGRKEKVDNKKGEVWRSKYPNLDLVHGQNMTHRRWKREEWRNKRYTRGWTEANVKDIEGWDKLFFVKDGMG